MKRTLFKFINYYCLFFIPLCLILYSLPAFAEEKTIGVIMTGDSPYYNEIHRAFTDTLLYEGLGPEKVEIIVQKPIPETISWINAVRKLVAYDVDLIVSYGAPATIISMEESSDIPIVFAGVYKPKALGLANKRLTGISSTVPISTLLSNFKQISKFSRLGVIYNNREEDTVFQANEVKKLEGKLGFHSIRFNIRNAEDTLKIAKGNVDALFISTCCAALQCADYIIDIAHKARLATATIIGGIENRVVLTIAADSYEQGSEVAKLASKLIKGTDISSMPIKNPSRVNIIINLREAKQMGLKVPFDLLSIATKVIQ